MRTESLSYWLQIRMLEPATVRDPEQYDGSGSLSIACTQTDLPATAQARLVQCWCDLLPTLANVNRVWFRSQVPQRLLDATAKMPRLTDLWIKWSSVKSLDALSYSQSLTNLHLGGSAQVQTLAPLVTLANLKWLTLENIKLVQNLNDIGRLSNLRGLGYSGGIWGKPQVDSLSPLSELKELIWLDVSSLRIRDGSLRPIAKLRSLQKINFPNYYDVEEYAYLRGSLPQLAADIQPYYTLAGLGLKCKKCKADLVSPIGRGAKNLCPTCDATALARHCSTFENLSNQHSARHGV